MMPSYLGDIQKLRHKSTKYNAHQGVTMNLETNYRCIKAIIDSAEITTIRTGAASGLATLLLANLDVRILAILKAGAQGSCHLEAMQVVRKLKRVRI